MDLELKDLNQFNGTEIYHKINLFSFANLTDGIIYIMENGYSWFVTDSLAVIGEKFKDAEFLAVKLKVKDSKAVVTYEDGNENILYEQKYEYTDAEKDLTLFYQNGVLFLSQEYWLECKKR